MHNDDVADLLHETEERLAEALRTLKDLRLRHARLRNSFSELDDLHRKDLNTLSLVSNKLKETQTELRRIETESARGL